MTASSIPVQAPLAARAAAGLPGPTIDVPMRDLEQARYLLGCLHGPVGSLTELRWPTKPGDRTAPWRSLFFESSDEAADLAVKSGDETDIYFGVHPRARRPASPFEGGGKEELLPGGGWMWVECDTQASIVRALNLEYPPPLVVRSSPGKAHCYWPLAGGLIKWDLIERGNRRLAWALGADPRACDAARILRVPGTRNHKYPDKPRVSITMLELASNTWPSHLVGGLPDPTPSRPTPVRSTRRTLPIPNDPDKNYIMAVPTRVWFERLTGREVYHNFATCPFHGGGQERTPSFHVAGPQDTLYFCFGCDEGGDVFTCAAKLWGLDEQRDFGAIKLKLKDIL